MDKKLRTSKKSSSILTGDFLLNSLSCPIFVYHHRKKNFVYVNKDFAQLLGKTVEECYGATPHDFLYLIEPQDREMLNTVIKDKLFSKIHKLVNKNMFRLCYSVNYRFRVNGSYEQMLQQVTAVEWDSKKNPILTFNMINNVTSRQKDQKITMTIKVFDEHNQEWKNVFMEEFLRKPKMLSSREYEIMHIMLNGTTATDIAKELNISFYTARAHMRNILAKTQCKSREQLKQLALKEGWI